ncbi:P-loop containing nucleoside triphosphate hydrolase protein, partial [Umbelopsis sp. AD052]
MSEADVLKIQNSSVNVVSHQKTFTFDYVFGPNSTQDEIFVTLASPLIHKFIDGSIMKEKCMDQNILSYCLTLFSSGLQGQTSSGKTYTMGTAQHGDEPDDIQNEGIIPRAMSLLFETLERTNAPNLSNGRSKLERKFRPLSVASALDDMRRNKSSIKVSFVEIYNEDLIDLLNPTPLSERTPVSIREDSKGQIYWSGTRNRATGSTDMNEKSSRSHAIFSVTLRQEKWVPSNGSPASQRSPSPSVTSNRHSGIRRPESSIGFRPQENGEEGDWVITHSKFHFVDLAGSERLKRTAAEGDRRKEGININGGLLALGNVISALGDPSKKSTHVPYRDSKLTRLLQDSLGGNATTLMIACVSPAEYNLIETVNTLMYANRARNIRNRLEKNEFEEWQTNDNAEFLRGIITKLKTELRAAKTMSIASSTASKDLTTSSHSLTSDGHTSPSSTPDLEQIFLDQRNEIMNLQHLIEKLEGELAVTRDREQVAGDQLKQMWKNESGPRSEDIEKLKQEVDFEHLVEPVIEEYEKSISVLESQLAMARAALHHSDIGFEEQTARITHLEQVHESQSHVISELRSRISKVTERELSNDLYIQELENKLSKVSQDSIQDQEAFNDLKAKLLKLTETEDSTEQYIGSLEQRLANVEREKDALSEAVQALEVTCAAKDTTTEALKIRVEQAERGDDQKMLLRELDDSLLRYQQLEMQHTELQSKYDTLLKTNPTVEKKEQVEDYDRNHLNELDSALEN